jgi:hypothetical protein
MQHRLQDRTVTRAASRAILAVVAAVLVVTSACASSERAAAPDPATAVAPTPAPSPAPPPDADRALPLPPVDPDAPHPLDCDAERRDAMRSPVATQLGAFADDDLTLAYAMTSPFFQRVLTADAFEALIRGEYPELIGNGGHRFDECRVRGRRGHLIVGVRDGVREVVLRYDLSEEPDGWRIDGAMRIALTLPPQPVA